MKIALDEHIPRTVLDAVQKLLEDKRIAKIEVVGAVDYVEAPSRSDVPWLRKFAEDGGKALITGDKGMRSRVHERKALLDLGLIVFFLPPKWNNETFMDRAAFLLRWWSVIVECAQTSGPSTCWEVPYIWTPDIEKIEDVTGPKEIEK